jgi:D-alanyl-lipoteichoic acid acyltransferase DltB (MBOAT superfamily)
MKARALVLAALLGILTAFAAGEIVPVLAWTDAFIPPARYPILFAAYFVTWLAVRSAAPGLRRAAVLGGSFVTALLFDATFAFASLGWAIGLHRALFTADRPHVARAVAYVAVTVVALAIACNVDLFDVGLELSRIGLLFALSYTFRIAWLLHEVRLRREVIPLGDLVAYFVFAPFFVIVPYMLAIPRCDEFREGLDRHDEDVERAGLRLLAWGTLLFAAVAVVIHTADPRPPFYAAARAHDAVPTLFYGLLSYPLLSTLNACAAGAVIVGLVRALGFRLAPSFDAPLLATSVADFWRRWNTHFRDLLVALFYYPVAIRLRRRPLRALLMGAAAVFLIGSVLFHYPKYYFSRGHLAPQVGLTLENTLMLPLVALALWREQRGCRRWLPRPFAIFVTLLLVFATVNLGNVAEHVVHGEHPPIETRYDTVRRVLVPH